MSPKVVICGSFHRDPASLELLIQELSQTNCQILSPFTNNFKNISDSFVRSNEDSGFSDYEIERFHLRSIKQADFIWLYNPNGYVGVSGSFEIGFAHSLSKPIFTFQKSDNYYIDAITNKVPSVFAAIKQLSSIALNSRV